MTPTRFQLVGVIAITLLVQVHLSESSRLHGESCKRLSGVHRDRSGSNCGEAKSCNPRSANDGEDSQEEANETGDAHDNSNTHREGHDRREEKGSSRDSDLADRLAVAGDVEHFILLVGSPCVAYKRDITRLCDGTQLITQSIFRQEIGVALTASKARATPIVF